LISPKFHNHVFYINFDYTWRFKLQTQMTRHKRSFHELVF